MLRREASPEPQALRLKVPPEPQAVDSEAEALIQDGLKALRRGRTGRRYILANREGNVTLGEFYASVARQGGIAVPRLRMPDLLAKAAGGAELPGEARPGEGELGVALPFVIRALVGQPRLAHGPRCESGNRPAAALSC